MYVGSGDVCLLLFKQCFHRQQSNSQNFLIYLKLYLRDKSVLFSTLLFPDQAKLNLFYSYGSGSGCYQRSKFLK